MNSSKKAREAVQRAADTDHNRIEPMNAVTRRTFIGGCGAAALSAGLTGHGVQAAVQEDRPAAAEQFRFIFFPDIHLLEDRRSPQGMAAALDSLKRLDPAPDFVVTGGDLIQNCRDLTIEQGQHMADLFVSIWNEHTDLPTYHMLGNHDPVGWRNEIVSTDHPLFGFNLLQQRLGLDRLYYSFDRNGWHFVILHNFSLTERGDYVAEFTEEQMDWLRDDLQSASGRPTLLFGHFPPLSAISFLDGRASVKDGDWTLSTKRMTRNPMALIDTINAVPNANVRAFFSGHIHRLDRIEAKGLTMICAGSVSGAQWRGPQVDTEEGYGIVDCRPDGTFNYRYHDYGWNAG